MGKILDPRFPGRSKAKYIYSHIDWDGSKPVPVLFNAGLFCVLMCMFYIREYEEKQSVAEYHEYAKRIYGIKTANDKINDK